MTSPCMTIMSTPSPEPFNVVETPTNAKFNFSSVETITGLHGQSQSTPILDIYIMKSLFLQIFKLLSKHLKCCYNFYSVWNTNKYFYFLTYFYILFCIFSDKNRLLHSRYFHLSASKCQICQYYYRNFFQIQILIMSMVQKINKSIFSYNSLLMLAL